MSRRLKQSNAPDDIPEDGSRALAQEFDKLSRETTTDAILDALENELRDWAPQDDEEGGSSSAIDRLNRELVAKSIFREGTEEGYHEDVGNMRPIESEVRRGLEELKQLIDQGRPPRRK